jgi:hypothetical protein
METLALPAAMPLGRRVKFTVDGFAVTLSDSASVAFKLTLVVAEFNWACAAGPLSSNRIAITGHHNSFLIFINELLIWILR